MKWVKKFLFIFLFVAAVCCNLSACSSSKPENRLYSSGKNIMLSEMDVQGINNGLSRFTAQEVYPTIPYSPYSAFIQNGDKLFVYDGVNEKDSIYELNMDGNETYTYSIPWVAEGVQISVLAGNSDDLWISYSDNVTSSKKYCKVFENGSYSEEISISSEIGNIINEKVFSTYLLIEAEQNGTYTLYVFGISGDQIAKIILSEKKNLIMQNASIILLSSIPDHLTDGCMISTLDLQTSAIEDVCWFDTGSVRAVDDDSIYIGDSTTVYSYDMENQTTTPLFTWDSLGISEGVLFPTSNNDFLCSCSSGIYKIFKTESDEKQQITLAVNSDINQYSRAIRAFNSSNSMYEVVTIDYSKYQEGEKILKTELLSDNAPDIIDITTFSADILTSDAIEDLTPYLENEKVEWLQGPIENMKVDGQLKSFIPRFTIYTLLCPEPKNFPENIDTFCMEVKDNVNKAFGQRITRNEFLRLAFCSGLAQEYSEKELSSILEIAKALPDMTSDDLSKDQSFDGIPTYSSSYLGTILALSKYREKNHISPNVHGIPFLQSNSGIIMPLMELSMTASSNVKDGVWEFFMFLLSQDFYDETAGVCLMPTKDYYDYSITWNTEAAETSGWEPVSDSDVEQFNYLINNLYGTCRNNSAIYDIVLKNVGPYFSDERNINEITTAILSKIQIYIAEQS